MRGRTRTPRYESGYSDRQSAEMLVGDIVSQASGSGLLTVRITGSSARTISNVKAAQDATYAAGDQVLLGRAPNNLYWLAVAKISTAPDPLGGENTLHPPEGLTAKNIMGSLVVEWENWPGACVGYELQHNSLPNESDSSYITRGSYYIYNAETGDRYVRLRSLRYNAVTGEAYYSGWTSWLQAEVEDPTFLMLTDTPSDYAGHAESVATVNLTEDGLTFAGVPGEPGSGFGFGNAIVVAKEGGHYAVVQNGINAASSEEHVYIQNGSWFENISSAADSITISGLVNQQHTGTFGVRIGGADDIGPICTITHNTLWSNMLLAHTLSGGSGAYIGMNASDIVAFKHLSDLRVRVEGGATGRNVTAVKIGSPGSYPSTVNRCAFVVKNAGSGVALECTGGEGYFKNRCEFVNEDGNDAVLISGTGTYYFDDCRIGGNVSITGAATVHLRNCDISGNITATAAVTLQLKGCNIDGDVTASSGGTLSVEHCTITGTISGWTTQTGMYIDNNGNSNVLNGLVFATDPVCPSQEGAVCWNDVEHTLNLDSGSGPVLQVGHEIYVLVYNNTVDQIDNGSVVYPTAIFNGFVSIEKAIADSHENISIDLGVCTMDIPASSYGLVTWFGKVRGLDTSLFSAGDDLWLSATVAGEFVNSKPVFPNYVMQIGAVAISDALDGVIYVDIKGRPIDTTLNSWNGTIRESFDFIVTSNGTTITGTLSPQGSQPDLTLMFSDGLTTLDTSPALTIVLTAGSATVPQMNYVYIPQSTKVLTASTSDWPTTEHAKVATILLRTAAITQEDGALRNQNWNDHLESTNHQGHFSHVWERIRQENAKWDTGIEGSVTIDATPTPDDVYAKVTSGVVYQMHRQAFPALDMTQYTIDAVSQGSKTFTISGDGDLSSTFTDGREIKVNDSTGNDGRYTIVSTVWSDPDFIITVVESIPSAVVDGTIGDDMHVVNDFTSPYTTITNLNQATADALGVSLSNSSFSFVMWGAQNKSGETCHLFLNLPTGSYGRLSPDLAVDDASNYAVYDIPKSFEGVGFLIARFIFTRTATGNDWTLYATQDLRGFAPNAIAGGGAGGGGATSFLALTDTPSSYIGQALKLLQVNTGETALELTDTITLANTGLHLLDTDASHDLIIKPGSNLTADRTLTVTTGDADRTVTLSGNLTVEATSIVNQDMTTDADVLFASVALPNAGWVGIGSGDERVQFYTAGYVAVMGANFGVGTITPGDKLVVNSGTTDSAADFVSSDRLVRIKLTDDSDTALVLADGTLGVMSLGFQSSIDPANVTIDTLGRFGIGAIAPSERLQVEETTLGDNVRLRFRSQTAGGAGRSWYFSHDPDTSKLHIGQAADSSDWVQDSSGNIGIGVSPSTRLDIDAGAMEFAEMTAPAAGAANTARLFARDNGSGKTQLCVRFNSGAIQVLATEP